MSKWIRLEKSHKATLTVSLQIQDHIPHVGLNAAQQSLLPFNLLNSRRRFHSFSPVFKPLSSSSSFPVSVMTLLPTSLKQLKQRAENFHRLSVPPHPTDHAPTESQPLHLYTKSHFLSWNLQARSSLIPAFILPLCWIIAIGVTACSYFSYLFTPLSSLCTAISLKHLQQSPLELRTVFSLSSLSPPIVVKLLLMSFSPARLQHHCSWECQQVSLTLLNSQVNPQFSSHLVLVESLLVTYSLYLASRLFLPGFPPTLLVSASQSTMLFLMS